MYQTLRLAKKLAYEMDMHKGDDVILFDVRGHSSLCDYVILLSGLSTKKVLGLAEEAEEVLSAAKANIKHIEGHRDSSWIIIDANDIIIHVMTEQERGRMRLEQIYQACPRVDYSSYKKPKKGN
jgi:ribosome-associated protein